MFNVDTIRKDFPLITDTKGTRCSAFLDNAATTQKPQAVIDALVHYYKEQNSNIHRGSYFLSRNSTELYDRARNQIRSFINASSAEEIIFTKSVTEAINLVADSYCKKFLKSGSNIIVTELEHHSNLLPWQAACSRFGAEMRMVPVDSFGILDMATYKAMLDANTAIIAVTGASNSTGSIPPIRELIQLAHLKNVPVLIDGAQAIAHCMTDVQKFDCDFYCFSGHKLYAPTGIGVLYGKKKYLEAMPPYQFGGDMIDQAYFDGKDNIYKGLPEKFEAGTPNIAGAIGLGQAIHFLQSIGLVNMITYEEALTTHAVERMKKIEGVRLIGAQGPHVPIISFTVDGLGVYDISTFLDLYGISTRCGELCAQPIMRRLGLNGTVRVSFAIYNTKSEIDYFCEILEKLIKKYRGRPNK